MRCQLVGAADVAPNSRLVTWFVGGLNLHIEHHLFPRVAAVRLPELSPIVRTVARTHGIALVEFPTMRSAVASHQRQLRSLGARPI
jgi:linoleoyl-CoA desaturase